MDAPATQPGRAGHSPARRIALNTVIFSIATGLSRIAGLIREIVASSYFGTSGPFSAFTIAFQVPNLVRALVADSALTAAFVPVFTELLEQKKRKEAFELAGALFGLILVVLGVVTVVFIAIAPIVIPPITGGEFTTELDELTVGLSRVMFPIVSCSGLNGLVVGILNAYDHFTIPAIAPLVWNFVIIAGLVAFKPLFHGPNQLYAYAIGVLLATVVQLGMCLPVLKHVGFHLSISFHWRDPRIKTVLMLMLPVTIGLGLINFNVLINSSLGSLVSEEAPAAIDRAFRLYMLPQGIFSVAVATVLFPTMSRYAARGDIDGLRRTSANGVRQIAMLLIPAAVFTAVLAEALTRLVYQRGEFGVASTDAVTRGAVLVLLLAPVQRRQPPAHAHVLLAPAPVVPDRAGAAVAVGQRRCVGGAVRVARHRGHRDRHGRRERGDDRRPGVLPAARSCTASRSAARCGPSR